MVGIPTSVQAAAAAPVDPIFAAIEAHKAVAAIYDAAAHARGTFPDLNPTEEQRHELARLDEADDDAYEACQDAAADLINAEPTTLAGIVTVIQYVRIQVRNDGVYMPHHLTLDTGCGPEETMGWIDAFLDTIENAAAALAKGGRA